MRKLKTEKGKDSSQASQIYCEQAASQLEIQQQNRNQKKIQKNSNRNLKKENEVQSQFPNNQFNFQNPAEHHLIKLAVSVKLQQMGFSSQVYEKIINEKIKSYQAREVNVQKNSLTKSHGNTIKNNEFKSLISQISQQILYPKDKQPQNKKKSKQQEIIFGEFLDSRLEVIQVKPKNPRKDYLEMENNNRQISLKDYQQSVFIQEVRQFQPIKIYSQIRLPKASENYISQLKQPKLCLICYYESRKYQELDCCHSFCSSCIKQVLLQDLQNGSYQLKCPQFDCQGRVPEQLAQKLLGQTKFTKYMHFRNKMLLQADPCNHFCTKPDCQQLLMQKQGNSVALTCKKCNIDFCKVCLQSYHSGECDIVLKNKLQTTYSQFKIKKCPKCQSPIQKIDGCNQMKCKKCKYNFCWLCLRKYSVHHFRYYNCFGCPGMQFQQEQQYCQQRLKQFFFFLLLPLVVLLGVLAFAVSIPIYMIFCLLVKPMQWTMKRSNEMCEISILENICCCLHHCLRNFFGYIIFIPRALLYSIFLSPVKLVAIILYQTCGIETTCRREL